jgi:hypothetical protein
MPKFRAITIVLAVNTQKIISEPLTRHQFHQERFSRIPRQDNKSGEKIALQDNPPTLALKKLSFDWDRIQCQQKYLFCLG